MISPPNLDELQRIIGYRFNDAQLLSQALTHRSYINESKNNLQNNERLEFLGDAIVELWSSDLLYSEFPSLAEGELTNLRSLLVRTENLASVSQTLNLGQYLYLSHGEATHGGRTNISLLADTFESLVGAIYLDSDIKEAFSFLSNHLGPTLASIRQQKIIKDPKSYFQEICQSQTGVTPHYQIISQTGPDHAKIFESQLLVNDRVIATGKGNSKQKAEEAAANAAIDQFSQNQKI